MAEHPATSKGGEDGIMTLEAILTQALAMLQRLECMTYRSRQRQCTNPEVMAMPETGYLKGLAGEVW